MPLQLNKQENNKGISINKNKNPIFLNRARYQQNNKTFQN